MAGPASYVKDLFESIGIANAKDKAAGFYAVMYFYYSMYDGAEDKQNVKDEFDFVSDFCKIDLVYENFCNRGR